MVANPVSKLSVAHFFWQTTWHKTNITQIPQIFPKFNFPVHKLVRIQGGIKKNRSVFYKRAQVIAQIARHKATLLVAQASV